jgi:hypothetical protein
VKALITGLMTFFNAAPGGVHNSFWTDVGGRLYFVEAPQGTNLSDGPYATFFPISDVNDDVFTKEGKEVYVQFSLFSGSSSAAEILDMDTHLSALFKDKVFTVPGTPAPWTVVVMRRVQGSGPINVPADTEAGTGRYWQTDVDFTISIGT